MAGLMKRLGLIVLVFSLGSIAATTGNSRPSTPPDEPKQGFRAEIIGQLGFVEKRIEDLAGAMPAEKYSWRPGDGVRSVGEVYMHIVGANYLFMSFLGVKPPMKMDPGMEKSVTDKAEIAAKFKPSFEHFRKSVLELSDKDLDKSTTMFGRTTTYRNVLVTAIAHMHEHLGQSIAYARMNGVVPPWTAAEQAEAAKKDAK
ncbi:MAG TPA: DinB family protein [Bacteroidota bacterium]|nr:DinB family protein [Bacteroidota bacterium]